MSKKIEAAEAYAFVEVVAPRLEQLRRRLVSANAQLKNGDPETARLAAIMESQLAIKEFLGGIKQLTPLIEPIDVLLEAVREESAEREPPPPEPLAPEPLPPPQRADAPKPGPSDSPPPDSWLRIGTAVAVERLTNAGMQASQAESYVRRSYAAVGLKQADGSPISDDTVREWRAKFGGPGGSSWRRKTALKQRIGSQPASAGTLTEAQQRVDQMAVLFKRMAQLAASRG